VRAAWRYGSWTVARQLADAVLDAWRKRFPENDTFVLLMRYHRVNVLWSEGDFEGVQDQATDIHERFRQTLGPNAEYTLMTATILAASEQALGHFGRARALNRDILDRLNASSPERNRRRLNAANNLADSERLLGRYSEAQRLDQETLQRRRTWLGTDHPSTLQSHASLGYDRRTLGNLQDSLDDLTYALAGLERVVGAQHEDTIRTRKSLAATWRKLDELADASRLIEQAAKDADAVFPRDHPDLFAIQLERAAVLAAMRRTDEARLIARDVVGRFERRFADQRHPFHLAAEANLVAYTRLAGRLSKLELRTARRVHSDLADVLGPRHPWAIAAQINLGNCLFDLEEFSEAHALDESTYEMAKSFLGADHPDTLVAELNLAVSSDRNRHASTTAWLAGDVVDAAERRFGASHRITRAVNSRQRLDCDLELPPF
jgi:tetratricopeptide (TPR) repeat protein